MGNFFESYVKLTLLSRRQDAIPVLQATLEVFHDIHDVILAQGSVILGIDWPRRRAVRRFSLSYFLLYRLLDDQSLLWLFWKCLHPKSTHVLPGDS